MTSCELTILMPCLNEAETLATCIQKAKTFLTEARIQGEILIADNGSTDGSQRIAELAGARVVNVATKGYGAALKGGMAAAQGKYIVMGDADDSYNFLNLTAFVEQLRQGHDLVMGNRFQGGIQKGAMPFLNRYLGNPVLSLLGRLFFKNNIGDFHCGLRGFQRERMQALQLQGDGMEFASEMIVKATLHQFKMTEVPTTLSPDGRNRKPHLRPWRDGWRHLRLLLLFSPRWLFFYPGLALLMIGFFCMALLLQGPVDIAGINFDIHTMLFCSLFMLVGMQAIWFSVFAKTLAAFELKQKQSASWLTLERGLILGMLLSLAGLGGAGYSFYSWAHLSFGNVNPVAMMRWLIPSVTSIVLGVQMIFSSFFKALLERMGVAS
jgi:glycosyltransferase involved in cell wall biosynthesis